MPFPFREICTLLARIEAIELHDPPLLNPEKTARIRDVIQGWFKSHRRTIRSLDARGATALLSCLLPEWRTDRVYNIQTARLCKRVGRVLRLSSERRTMLAAYKTFGRGDLADCIERVLKECGPPALPLVNLEEVDSFFNQMAALCQFSDSSFLQAPPSTPDEIDATLSNLVHRMEPLEAKWLMRLILKDLSPLHLDENLVLRAFHFLLPNLLCFQRNFFTAVSLLMDEFREYPECPDPASAKVFQRSVGQKLRPVVGTKVGRPEFCKARGIDHCLSMVGARTWVAERKYDGEYCEIHVDLRRYDPTRPSECLKIFSKSGKDLTVDRKDLHPAILSSLRIGHSDCRVKTQAILLGEMVVYSDTSQAVMPFEHIRRHVRRSGRFIGNAMDSPPSANEHLAIVFFDLLLVDEQVTMRESVEQRRKCLRQVCVDVPGRAMRAEWKLIDFTSPTKAKKSLIEQFAMSIARRHEGLVLKACGVPYMSFSDDKSHGYIKVKKDLMNMGDEAEFAVIGASYDAQVAAACPVKNLTWTTFHLGSLNNKSDVQRYGSRPEFKHMGTIDCGGQCIPRDVLQAVNILGKSMTVPVHADQPFQSFDVIHFGDSRMEVEFTRPFVFEVVGSKFAKPPNQNHMMLIFPRVKKLHQDRSFQDCPSFEEVQQQAQEACALPDRESQETREWINKLERRCKRKCDREATSSLESNQELVDRATTATVIAARNAAKRPPTLDNNPGTGKRLRVSAILQPAPTQPAAPACPTSPLTEISPNTLRRLLTRRWFKMNTEPAAHPVSEISTRCRPHTCLFANATIYLVDCISRTPYISADLLSTHDSVLIPNLSHWDRDSYACSRATAVSPESQSHPGMRKIVLVERRREPAVQRLIQMLEGLNAGRFRERVDVFDWRMLEECGEHDRGAKALMRHFVGATVFDEVQGRGVFVSAATVG